MRTIAGLLIAGLGVVIIVYAASLAKMFGRREWAERHLGGTMQGYIAIGFIVIILGIVSIFGSSFAQKDPTGFQLTE